MFFYIAMNADRLKDLSNSYKRPGMGIPLQREAVALVTMVGDASTVVKTRDASGELLRFRVVRATRPGSL
jgi:hypothetical protein